MGFAGHWHPESGARHPAALRGHTPAAGLHGFPELGRIRKNPHGPRYTS